jgi:hypothetical protein
MSLLAALPPPEGLIIQYEQSPRAGTPLTRVLSDRFAIFELTNSAT